MVSVRPGTTERWVLPVQVFWGAQSPPTALTLAGFFVENPRFLCVQVNCGVMAKANDGVPDLDNRVQKCRANTQNSGPDVSRTCVY